MAANRIVPLVARYCFPSLYILLPFADLPPPHPQSGHTRPVTQLSFSSLQDDGTYLLISSCKDGKPMLRDWTGDWIGTFMGGYAPPLASSLSLTPQFLGHKGAVWSSKLSSDTSRAVTGSADFTASVPLSSSHRSTRPHKEISLQQSLGHVHR